MDRTRRLAMVEEDARKEVRWSASRKGDAVMRLLRGEDLDEVSRELRVEAHRLAAWRDEFMAGGLEGLKARPLAPEDRRVKEAERKIGELTLENEILQPAIMRVAPASTDRPTGPGAFPWMLLPLALLILAAGVVLFEHEDAPAPPSPTR